MRQSQLFSHTRKELPAGEESTNAKLLIQAGFIDKLMAGVYTFLPLGDRVLKKIEQIIREEMDSTGAQEILMPALNPKENWVKTGRWESMHDILFKLKGVRGSEFTLGPTHEEVVTPLASQFISSYKDLPRAVYQIQTKFRNEARAKSGLLRGREFRMKDIYSFHADEADLDKYYESVEAAYERVWDRVGLGSITVKTFASGGEFAKYSHEYQTLDESGEDEVYLCEKCNVAVNKEIIDEQKACPECGEEGLKPKKGIEVGNIFKLKTKFSDAFNLKYTDEKGEQKPVQMGCYGIGPSRVMGTIVEVFNDDNGIIWPEEVAPFKYHLVNLSKSDKVKDQAEKVYQHLIDRGDEVLFDDRPDPSPGAKLKDADLIGLPIRLIVSDKTDSKIEFKKRNETETKLVDLKEL